MAVPTGPLLLVHLVQLDSNRFSDGMQQQIVTRGLCFVNTTIDNLFYVSIELGISAANLTHTAVVHTLTLGDRVRTRFNKPWAGDDDGTSLRYRH